MPDSLTNCSGCNDSPQHASTRAAVTESWPHPAHRVDMLPSYWRRVSPNSLVGSEGGANLGLLMYDIQASVLLTRHRAQSPRLRGACAYLIDHGLRCYRQTPIGPDGKPLCS